MVPQGVARACSSAVVELARVEAQIPGAFHARASDRNLLFGLLALQNGMIDQSVLVAAFHAWTRDKKQSIAEILLGQRAIDDDDRTLLEGLVAKHLKRHGDDAEKSLAAVKAPRPLVNELAGIGDAQVDATIGHLAMGSRPSQHGEGEVADAYATSSLGRVRPAT